LTVTDDTGSIADTLTVTVSNVDPTVDAGTGKTGNEGSTVSFSDATATDPGAETLSYGWQFGDGNTSSGSLSSSHAYTNDGTYIATLTVTDDTGSIADTLTVMVSNVDPTANAGDDLSGTVGISVVFSGEATDPGDDQLSYSWDFGDSSATVSGTLTPSHTYTANGDHLVTLTVTDGDGGEDIDTLWAYIGPTIWYVDKYASGLTQDGRSWQTAFLHPQNGSDFANSGDQVWVAEGSYASMDTTVPDVPILMMKSGVLYYGGFAATETSLSQRDLSAYATTLDGDGITEQIVIGADNSLLSGFVVAHAMGDTLNRYNAPVNASDSSNFRIHDSVIAENVTRRDGVNGSSGLNIADGEVVNTVFRDNLGRNAPIYIVQGSEGVVDIVNSVIHHNEASYGGGIIVSGKGNVRIINTTIADNISSNGGTGIFIDNTTIFGPTAINNSIVWGEINGLSGYPEPTIAYSNIRGGLTSGTNIAADPQFIDAANDNYQLNSTSPSIDTGNNSLVWGTITTDLAGNNRILDGTVDMGAYEYVSP